jgi:hypothetical protein
VTLRAVAWRPGLRRTAIEAGINADFAFVSEVVRLDVPLPGRSTVTRVSRLTAYKIVTQY